MAQLITRIDEETNDLAWIDALWQKPIQRVFWIYNIPETSLRGGHYHQTCRMVLQCVKGSVEVYIQTPQEDQYFTLNAPNQFLLLEAQDWRLMHHFSPDAMLVVFADKPFDTTVYLSKPYRTLPAL